MPEPSVRFLGVSKELWSRRSAARGSISTFARRVRRLGRRERAGKTTLIKCLLDFCDLDSGSIEIHGTPHHRPPIPRPPCVPPRAVYRPILSHRSRVS